jgi:hypothetical protein
MDTENNLFGSSTNFPEKTGFLEKLVRDKVLAILMG